MTRGMLVAGNWKMNLSMDAAIALASDVAGGFEPRPGLDVAVFPSFPWLSAVRTAVGSRPVAIGAQNCHSASAGAFTGEVSARMLLPFCSMVLAGHSERRHLFGESDEQIGAKVRAILDAELSPVLCVGETLDERRSGSAQDVVGRQLERALSGCDVAEVARTTVAYEPVWAIGTGVAATTSDAQAMCSYVRQRIAAPFGSDVAEGLRILYGGSVSPENAKALFGQPDIDGGLVGGASLNAASFLAIIAAAAEIIAV